MDTHPTPKVAPHGAPDDLLQQLHTATEHFHQQKQAHEQAMADTQIDHEQRVGKSRVELQKAEQELEEITKRIKDELDRQKDSEKRGT